MQLSADTSKPDLPELHVRPSDSTQETSEDEIRLARILSGAYDGDDGRRAVPQSGWRRLVLLGLGLVLLVLLTLAAALLLRDRESPAEAEPAAPRPVAAPDLVFEPSPVRSRFVSPLHLEPPHLAQSAVSLEGDNGGQSVRLAFVDGLVWGAICQNDEGLMFSCGLQGRAALHRFLRNEPAMCQPVFYWRDETRYQCFGVSGDLGRLQVAAGFAKPDPMGLGLYGSEAAEAARNGEGAWNGNWTIREVR